ncbi:hypothetical protein Nisw_06705 [Candidatus Nitrosopumilus sp. SW]|uniref:hypothetical protein n=1 Tax=Candidatus Nitrosopumilus sp. SW TaxID=2508726 RepID=UPI0011522C26|nr:hypothetical protein [Candidatus Nitrosopumilus sp. SW]QDI89235.1 hypothetical protein Nisw_06705 [Candidatus Nitrosopumilus sp. SW]
MLEDDMNFDKKLIQKIWEKGRKDANLNSNVFRQDRFGAWIKHAEYNKSESMYGWTIIKNPDSKDSEYIPIHLKNCINENDTVIECNVTSAGTTNIQHVESSEI